MAQFDMRFFASPIMMQVDVVISFSNMKVLFAFAVVLALVAADNTVIMPPPPGVSGQPAAFVFIHGAQIPNTNYQTISTLIQKMAGFPLWVALPGFALDMPNPLQVQASVTDAIKNMQSQGLPTNAPIFYGGHSLGSVIAQDYLFNNSIPAAGLILTGGFLQRKYLVPRFNYAIPTLTLGGELDGLSRVTRIAESYYNQITVAQRGTLYPVVVLNGVSHFQFAGEGAVPFLVKERDLMPEATQEDAWQSIASLTTDFMRQLMRISGGGQQVAAAVQSTGTFVNPIIQAFVLEGSRHFNAPRQVNGYLSSTCVRGGCPDSSAWSMVAQKNIGANLDGGWALQVSNNYVELSANPLTGGDFHLPAITSQPATHSVAVTTYTQGNWDILDDSDTGFSSVSVNELGVKLASRQCLLIVGTGAPNTTSFSVDDPQFCQMTNQQAYQYAMSNAGAATLARFQRYGQKYVFGDDLPKEGGPLWLYARVEYNSVTDAQGNPAIQIVSPMQKTDINYWDEHFFFPRPSSIPDPGCFHYCKLLSPARAMEWIYVDSLRLNRHI